MYRALSGADPGPIRTVLLVDADREASLAVAKGLRERRYRVLFAMDGVQALNVARERRPDSVVLNMDLPAGGGLSFIERLRRNVHTDGHPGDRPDR